MLVNFVDIRDYNLEMVGFEVKEWKWRVLKMKDVEKVAFETHLLKKIKQKRYSTYLILSTFFIK